ncbi:MAG: hypothetical protein ACOYB4_06035 [Methyloceanibacter sp.]
MKTYAATLFIATVSAFVLAGGAANAQSYSKIVTKSCTADYKKYCGEYGIESPGLRSCMDKNGRSLSKTCVNALVKAGHVSQAEVDRRKKSKR